MLQISGNDGHLAIVWDWESLKRKVPQTAINEIIINTTNYLLSCKSDFITAQGENSGSCFIKFGPCWISQPSYGAVLQERKIIASNLDFR